MCRDAEQGCAAFHDSTELAEVKRTALIMNLLTVREILDEDHVQKGVRYPCQTASGSRRAPSPPRDRRVN